MKKNLGVILTALDEANQDQFDVIKGFHPAASRTYVLSKHEIPETYPGVFWQKSVKPRPLVRDAIVYYMGKFRGFETVGICNPDVQIEPDFTKLFNAAANLRLHNSWAFRYEVDAIPRMFVMTSNILKHMNRDLDQKLVFAGDEWIWWMHEWLDRTLLAHKYVDASELENVSLALPPEPVPAPPAPDLTAFEFSVDTHPDAVVESPKKARKPRKKKENAG